MVGFLLMSHGDLSEGLISTLKCIVGVPEKIEALTLAIEDDISLFEEKIAERIEMLDDGDGVLVMVDMLGGTPSNKSAMFLRDKNIELLTGMNFPMLMGAYESRMGGNDLLAIRDYSMQSAKEGILSVREHLKI